MKCVIILLFVLSVIVPVPILLSADDKPPYYMTDEQLDKKLGVDEKAETPEMFIWVVYFHRVPGCDTCQLMSRYVYEAVDANFSDEVKVKDLVLRYRNFEDKKNESLVKKLKIKSPSLAILIVKDGKPTKAKLAGKIWSLAKNKKEFTDYVMEEINSYRKEIKKER